MALKDPVIKKERELLKKGEMIEAIEYLTSEAKKHPVESDLFFKYYFRSLDISIKVPELFKQSEESLMTFTNHYEKIKKFSYPYSVLCDKLFRLAINEKDGNKAMIAARRFTHMLQPNHHSYITIYRDFQNYAKTASQYMNLKQIDKDVEYLYRTLMYEMLDISWHLYGVWDYNMLKYDIKTTTNFKSENHFRKFDTYNVIKSRFVIDKLNDNSIHDLFNEDDAEAFSRIAIDPVEFVMGVYKLYFDTHPKSLEFDLEFLEPEYDDLCKFGKSFTDKNINKEIFIHNSHSKASELSNEFIRKYTKIMQ